MIRKRNRIARRMIVVGSIFGSTGELLSELWHGDSTRRLMIPLVVFLSKRWRLSSMRSSDACDALATCLPAPHAAAS